jgi:hypothetical protein
MVSRWDFWRKRVFVLVFRYGKQAGIFGGEFFVFSGGYGKWGLLVYLTPLIPLSLRGVKGEGEGFFIKEELAPLLNTPFGGTHGCWRSTNGDY